jgi:hypothetical protein
MSTPATIPAEIRRFVLAHVATVPHLEALLLLHQHPHQVWSGAQIAGRLYIGDREADRLLRDLLDAELLSRVEDQASGYRYAASGAVRDVVERLDRFYPRNVVAIAELIHSKDARRAQRLADAFKFRRDS